MHKVRVIYHWTVVELIHNLPHPFTQNVHKNLSITYYIRITRVEEVKYSPSGKLIFKVTYLSDPQETFLYFI